MSVFIAIVAGIAGAAAGFGLGLLLGALLASIFGVSSFEGASGYFAGLFGLVFGLAGFIGGIVWALRRYGRVRGIGALAGRTALAIAVVALLVAGGVAWRLAMVEHFSGASPRMQFEIRLPEGMPAPDMKRIDVEMQAGSQRSGATFGQPRQEDGRVVLPGAIPLYTRTSRRMLVLRIPDQPRVLFRIGLASTPRVTTEFGPWQRADFIDDGKPDTQPRKPRDDEDYAIRYFVGE